MKNFILLIVLTSLLFSKIHECRGYTIEYKDKTKPEKRIYRKNIKVYFTIKNQVLTYQTATDTQTAIFMHSYPNGDEPYDEYRGNKIIYEIYDNFKLGARIIYGNSLMDLVDCVGVEGNINPYNITPIIRIKYETRNYQ